MYYGELQHVHKYMEKLGYPVPPGMGTSEHIMDCISRQPIEDETMEQAIARVDKLAQAAASFNLPEKDSHKGDSDELTNNKSHQSTATTTHRRGPKAGILRQLVLLLKRSFREVTRGKTAILVKTVQQVTLGLIYGGIYKLGTDQASIQDRFGLLSLVAIGSANMVRALSWN